MTEEEIMDELERLAIDWALEEEPGGTKAVVTDIVEVDPLEWITQPSGPNPDRAFVVNMLLDYVEATDEAEVEGEREVSALYGYFTQGDRFDLVYGADYPMSEPEDEEDEEFDDDELDDSEEEMR
jgi:hypothetical protein